MKTGAKKITAAMARADKARAAAKAEYHEEGTIEIDDDARVSYAEEEGGAYVQAWVWVDLRDEGEV